VDAAAARPGCIRPCCRCWPSGRSLPWAATGTTTPAPSAADGVDLPVHVLAVNALGLHLMDYLKFDELLPVCEREGRWSFLCVIAPLRLPTGTGSPVNPIAIM
jgi:hypothetical protein